MKIGQVGLTTYYVLCYSCYNIWQNFGCFSLAFIIKYILRAPRIVYSLKMYIFSVFNFSLIKYVTYIMPKWRDLSQSQNRFIVKEHMITFFYEKACKTYILLAENYRICTK